MMNATVKDNILFGKPLDDCYYYKVIETCALERDLELLSAADMTEIGEKVNACNTRLQRQQLPPFIKKVMGPPERAGGIMFLGCPHVCPSVYPSVISSEQKFALESNFQG